MRESGAPPAPVWPLSIPAAPPGGRIVKSRSGSRPPVCSGFAALHAAPRIFGKPAAKPRIPGNFRSATAQRRGIAECFSALTSRTGLAG